jgi:molybdate transport system permease protein
MVKGVLDVILTLPLVLPPTVIGFFILKVMGPKGAVGSLYTHGLILKLL